MLNYRISCGHASPQVTPQSTTREHKFDYPIKKLNRKRRNEVGQPAEMFYDPAIPAAQDAFLRKFEDYIKTNEDYLKER